ncbi:MFS transporter [Chondromyces crocatus]|uniref:MFS transporter n=1 Tax=Chondromyces crocatus TaxID=52 RepID=A0A0K1EG45_CHOCO|nr:MFS transporter [Chondromyces crocatus]AKT39845.1 MFS transporter [Chondromyces crocatus]
MEKRDGDAVPVPGALDAHHEGAPQDPEPTLDRRGRAAVFVVFFVNGALIAHWFSRIPAVKAKLQATDGAFGLALLATAFGALISMPLVGVWTARLGSRVLTVASAIGLCLCNAALPFAPSLPLLAVALLLWGASNGALDVSMNGQAVTVEKTYRRSIMSSFHAAFSLGGMAGALLGGRIAAADVGPSPHLVGVSLVSLLLFLAAAPGLVHGAGKARAAGPAFSFPARWLLSLGVIGLCSMLGEGAVADWSAVYLREVLGTSEGYAAMGYAAFSSTMAVGRLAGDRLTERLGAGTLVRAGGWLSAVGLCVALISGTPAMGVVGFACVGAGLSIVAPLVFGAAGRNARNSGQAIAAVTTTSYLGFFLGPPLIGLLSDALTVRGGLGVVVVTSVLIAVLASVRSTRLNGTSSPEGEEGRHDDPLEEPT